MHVCMYKHINIYVYIYIHISWIPSQLLAALPLSTEFSKVSLFHSPIDPFWQSCWDVPGSLPPWPSSSFDGAPRPHGASPASATGRPGWSLALLGLGELLRITKDPCNNLMSPRTLNHEYNPQPKWQKLASFSHRGGFKQIIAAHIFKKGNSMINSELPRFMHVKVSGCSAPWVSLSSSRHLW